MTVKTVNILGSTGSVGRSTVDLLRAAPDDFKVQVLTAQTNTERLAEQARQLNAARAVIGDDGLYNDLKTLLQGTGIKVSAGRQAVIDAAGESADWIMAAIVGMAGLEPLMAALNQGTCVAIANKEPLAAAGQAVMAQARRHNATILPVDSEHNAIFQVFEPENRAAVERIILTASGGPFRTWDAVQIAQATPEQAINHPNWSMGAKISVDCATMMNKTLEVIEAHHLFSLPPEKIEMLIHPQSAVHGMVEYADGSILAQMGAADMRTPIAAALAWPARMRTTGLRLDLKSWRRLEFEDVDAARFPAAVLAYECLKSGNAAAACVTLNAANEVAVQAFLERKIGFSDIYNLIRRTLDDATLSPLSSLEDIISYDKIVRGQTESYIVQGQPFQARRS